MKSTILKISEGLKAFRKKISDIFLPGDEALFGASMGIFIGFGVTLLLVLAAYIHILGWAVLSVMGLMLMVLSLLTAFLTVMALRLINKLPFLLTASIVAGIPVIMMYFHIKMPWTIIILLTIAILSALVGGAFWLIKKKWGTARGVNRSLIVINLTLGIAGVAGVLFWMLSPGSKIEFPESASMQVINLPPVIEAGNPAQPGPYAVQYLSYGSGEDLNREEYGSGVNIVTPAVDGSSFLESWQGISGKLRTRHFGFDQKKLPLNAKVWYPDGQGPFPLVLVVHGNHLAQHFSDPGYEYLGRLLASRGYIMASVDENFLNGSYTDFFGSLKDENDARAWILLKHLEQWREWNKDSLNTFFGKVDIDNIALIGHSRGGEAVAHAALFNRLPFYPDNALEVFNFNFNIKSIVAIAPCDGQYQPSRVRTPLEDISYFTLQGSHDADVSSFQGLRQLNRVNFTDTFDGFKAGLYVYAANHGQFNSIWGNKDFGSPRINFFNLRQLMPQNEQQQVAMVYISGFLEATLRNNTSYRQMFMDHRTAREWLPSTVYLNQYQQPGTFFVCTYQEDLDAATASLRKSRIASRDLSIWKEQNIALNWGDYDSKGVILGWNTTESDTLQPQYNISWPQDSFLADSTSLLVFSMAETGDKADPPKNKEEESGNDVNGNNSNQDNEKGSENKSGNEDASKDEDEEKEEDKEPDFIDFTIQLVSANGVIAEFPLSDCSPLQPVLKRKLTKLSFLQTAAESESIMQYFYFPLEKVLEGKDVDVKSITGINFVFNRTPTGVVAIDNIGFL